MANSLGKWTPYEVNEGVKGKAITGPSLFNPQSSHNSVTSRVNVVDKQSGSYIRTTVKENHSSGDVFKERPTGRIGFKDEQKVTTTIKIGDKSGFSEYQVEERFRSVNYDGRAKENSSAWETRVHGESNSEKVHEVGYEASVDGDQDHAWSDTAAFDDNDFGCDYDGFGYDDDYY